MHSLSGGVEAERGGKGAERRRQPKPCQEMAPLTDRKWPALGCFFVRKDLATRRLSALKSPMKKKKIRFGRPSEVTNRGDDSRSFLVPFSVVDDDLVGTPEQAQATSEHRLIVTVAGNRLPAWSLADNDLIRVLFEISRRDVADRVKQGTLKRECRVLVSTTTHSATCPFDPARIQEPEGYAMQVEEHRKIGFK